MEWMFIIVFEALLAFLFGTILFDIVHLLLHRFLRTRHPLLRAIGKLHLAHHHFFSVNLTVNPTFAKKNILQHVLFENAVQLVGIMFCAFLFAPSAIFLAIFLQVIIFITVLYQGGADLHHRALSSLPSYRGGWWVSRSYHALHHLFPNHFYSSYLKIIDRILGTSMPLVGKSIVMTGANGALGKEMKRLLKKAGANIITMKYGEDYTYDNYDKFTYPLKNADILLLCHGSKHIDAESANCHSFVRIIELFKAAHKKNNKLAPREVWAIGSEIECHPCFGIKKLFPYATSKRHFARFARVYFHDASIQYRHIVHSAFTSNMGPGLMSAKMAAWLTLFFLKRGFKYIPISYMGFGYLNYLRFIFKPRQRDPFSRVLAD